jgi:hypothetical protein
VLNQDVPVSASKVGSLDNLEQLILMAAFGNVAVPFGIGRTPVGGFDRLLYDEEPQWVVADGHSRQALWESVVRGVCGFAHRPGPGVEAIIASERGGDAPIL